MSKRSSPMCGVAVARYTAAASSSCWIGLDEADIQRKRDVLRSELAVLSEALRRLDEIENDDEHDRVARRDDDDDGQLTIPVAGGGGATASESFDDSRAADDDFLPLDDDDDEPERSTVMHWQDRLCRQMVYSSRQLRRQDDGDLAHLPDIMDMEAAAPAGAHGGLLVANSDHDLNPGGDGHGHGNDDDEISRDIVALGLHVPLIQHAAATPFVQHGGGGGFGATPASAAAIAGLGKQRYDGSGTDDDDDSTCVICMRGYKKGKRLRVMPCTHKHRFHRKCIRKWLSCSNLCPLCRLALPTAAEQRVIRTAVIRVKANPY